MSARRERLAEEESYRVWKGGYRSYDIVREACIALGAVVALTLLLTILFSSPDERPSTVHQLVPVSATSKQPPRTAIRVFTPEFTPVLLSKMG